ncbi:MAG: redox-sensing transcriptional repressor Rex [Oscillospiraceae bacterium]|nr:redox-sensing transcriptional repressor Rex [Oscillospiraceae bacterium]
MEKKTKDISKSVIRRLPKYYRYLERLLLTNINRVSSKQLGEIMGLTAPQIRQDLSCFGEFGQQGYGYNVSELKKEIGKILGVENSLKTIIVGVGNIGKAIFNHINFSEKGLDMIAGFDKDENIIGTNFNDLKILSISNIIEFCEKNIVKVAILCIPEDVSKHIVEVLRCAGVEGFWNFSNFELKVDYRDIVIENVHLEDSLMTLCYMINNKNKK